VRRCFAVVSGVRRTARLPRGYLPPAVCGVLTRIEHSRNAAGLLGDCEIEVLI
jgi:hypothetical protein